MKKVLIVSYIFPPNTTLVSAFRPYSWFKEFENYGLAPVVVTRHWSDEPMLDSSQCGDDVETPTKVIKEGGKNIYYLPYKNNFFESQIRKNPSSNASKIWELAGLLTGKFTKEADLFYSFKNEISKIIQHENPKLIILTALPLSAVKLGHYLKKEFAIPVVIDFRDYINNNLLNENFNFSVQAKFSFFVQQKYLKKWLSNIDAIMAVSQPILDKLAAFSKTKQILLPNGFEKDLFTGVVEEPRDKFTVSMIGMLYLTQDIDFIIKGFMEFIKLAGYPDDFVLELIGQDYLPEVSEKFKQYLPEQNIISTSRIPRVEAIRLMKSSHVLFYAGWKGWKGIYSGKIFEYLAAKRNILIAPGDDDVIDELIKNTKSGIIANTTNEFAQSLLNWYHEWKDNKKLSYHGVNSEIEKFTREALAQKLAKEINILI